MEGTERVIIPNGSAIGKATICIKSTGCIISYLQTIVPTDVLSAPARKASGESYETRVITADETFGYHAAPMTRIKGRIMPDGHPVGIDPADPDKTAASNIHQGGIVSTPDGEWWALLMMDFHSLGRTVTPTDYVGRRVAMIGLPGNLGRSPRTWLKPSTPGRDSVTPHAAYDRNDDFNGKSLKRIGSGTIILTTKCGASRMGNSALTLCLAEQLMWARNTLTQRAISRNPSPP